MGIAPGTTDLDLASVTTAEQLVVKLRTLYVRAGKPSYRTIETRTRHSTAPLSKSRVGQILNGDRFPNREAFVTFVQTCGVPDEELVPWVRAWERVAEHAEPGQRPSVAAGETDGAHVAPLAQASREGSHASRLGTGRTILPIYVLCDESARMTGELVDALNKMLPEMHEEIGGSPMVASKIRFCLIGFSDQARVLLPLCDLGEVASIPTLTAAGGTRYGAAFDLLRDTIIRDVADLREQGYRAMRPAVFVFTGSRPDDDGEWRAARDRVADLTWNAHPNILAFGFGEADESTVTRIASTRAFVHDGTIAPGRVLRAFIESLTQSIIASGARPVAEGAIFSWLGDLRGLVSTSVDLNVPSWLDGADVQESDLEIGDSLGMGGQGAAHELHGRASGYVYKKYLLPDLNGHALTRLVSLPGVLSRRERAYLLATAAWPLARVLEGSQVKGFIMRKAPPEFWGGTNTRLRLRELQYLLYEPRPMWGDITPPDAAGRLEVVRQIAVLFALLHSKHLVVGDVSMRNLLWSSSPIRIFMLDCDGIREEGMLSVMPYSQTPDWDDPDRQARDSDLESDHYKLALIIARVLTRNAQLRPGGLLEFLPGLPQPVVAQVSLQFAGAGGPRAVRPTAAQWVESLGATESWREPELPIEFV